MFDDPDLAIQWPPDLIVVELDSVGEDRAELERLLDEIFVGDQILEKYLAGEWGPPRRRSYGESVGAELVQVVRSAARSGSLREPKAKPPRWRQRTSGTDPVARPHKPLSAALQKLLVELDGFGYFDSECHVPCVDDSYDESVKPSLDIAVADEFGEYIQLEFLPRSARFRTAEAQSLLEHERGGSRKIVELNNDEMYELIEIFHDLAARPRQARYHDYGACGYHYARFSRGTGQRLYRWRVNRLLSAHGMDLEFAEGGELEGRLVRATDSARSELIELAAASAPADELDELEHAIRQFRHRRSSRQDKISAIVTLAGLLERHRELVKEHLDTKDEGALFEIANRFGLRHKNKAQQDDYHDDFLDWVFWWYLATVELTQRIRAREK